MNKPTKLFLIILSIFIISWILLLFTTPLQYTNSDESVAGIMTKHIMEKGERPFFFYGHSIAGGTTIIAYLTVIPYLIFGMSGISLKVIPLVISMLLLITLYIFSKKFFGYKVAIISSILFVFSPPLMTYINFDNGYHIEALLLGLIIFYLFFLIFFENKTKAVYPTLLGFLCAFSYYDIPTNMVLILSIFLFWFLLDKAFFKTKRFWIFFTSLIISSIPLICYNIVNNLSNVKALFDSSFVHKLVCNYNLLSDKYVYCLDPIQSGNINIINFFIKNLPSFFGITIYSYITYVVFLVALLYLIYSVRSSIKNLITKKKPLIAEIKKETFIVIFVLTYLVAYLLRGMDKARYLAEIYPFMLVIMGIFMAKIHSIGKKKAILFSNILLIILIFVSIIGNLGHYNYHYTFNSEFHDIPEIIDFLESNDISHVYTDWTLKWHIIFMSKERIIASCDHMCYCLGEGRKSIYPLYEKLVNDSDEYAYVTRYPSGTDRRLRLYLENNAISFNEEIVSDKRKIYHGFSSDLRPDEVMKGCDINDMDDYNPKTPILR